MVPGSALNLHDKRDFVPAEVRGLFDDLTLSERFERLRRIAFLGAIERFSGKDGDQTRISAGSRHDHSIGVARLLVDFQETLQLSAGEFRIALVHALLHDIGHGPFSHSSEPFFKAAFGVDHHRALSALVEDRSSEISRILARYGLWLDYRRFIREPTAHPIVSTLFYGPINLDTIEGILRAARFFNIRVEVEGGELVGALARRCIAVKPLDRFWDLKARVYNDYIFADHATADRYLSAVLFSVRDEVQERDFALTDDELEEKFSRAFLDNDRASWRSPDSPPRQRRFRIRARAIPSRIGTLNARYTEARTNDEPEHSRLP
jgi:uncharacterized protein